MAGKTLVVVPGQGDFVFYFEDVNDDRYWRVRGYPGVPGWFLVEEYQNGWYSGEFYDAYENAGVSDLQGLLERLVREPEATLEGFFGNRTEVASVVVKDNVE